LYVSLRPLALLSGLTLGDYLLWNWSLSGNRDVLALVSGLTLPPVALACLWLLALNVARLMARAMRRSPVRAAGERPADRERPLRTGEAAAVRGPSEKVPASATGSSAPSSGKLAA
jgi:hypothetical protein